MTEELAMRLRLVKLLSMDVDGVLTDGGIEYGSDGGEHKRFFAGDGLGIGLLVASGIRTAIITGRSYPGTERRAIELGVSHCVQNAKDKGVALAELRVKLHLGRDEVMHIGDDWNDIPAFLQSGITAAPMNAVPEVRNRADIVTEARGGYGAVREVCMMLLAAHEPVDVTLSKFLERLSRSAPVVPG